MLSIETLMEEIEPKAPEKGDSEYRLKRPSF